MLSVWHGPLVLRLVMYCFCFVGEARASVHPFAMDGVAECAAVKDAAAQDLV